ncbi:MAG: MFS transporter [Anaerolineales bacterium]|jgi:FSR family fosmidomycin resistance protein-like MFS transporter
MGLLLDKLFTAVALGHFSVDVLNGGRSVLFTYLSVPLGLSNTALGFFSTLYVVSGALTQPIFGYITDKFGPRWVAAGGLLWMAVFYSMAIIAPVQYALWLLILASLGSAAYHPAGTMQATLRGRTHFQGKETTSAAYFFVAGQAGLFMGPLLAGNILDRFGKPGILILTAFAVPVGVNVAGQLRNVKAVNADALGKSNRLTVSKGGLMMGLPLLPLITFVLLAFFQSWAQQNMVTFVPKYLSDLGQSASTYGMIAALFMGGSAVGNAVGGNLADRFGKRRVAMVSLALASIPLYLVSAVGLSQWLYYLIPLGGALTGASHSIIVVLAQRLFPGGMGLASGLILGFMFSSGAIGTLASGSIADSYGLTYVFQFSAALVLGGSAMAWWLRQLGEAR